MVSITENSISSRRKDDAMRKKVKYLAALVALATFTLYLPALRNSFVGVWDDNLYVVLNPHIRSLDTAFFRWAFLDFYASNWHPLTWISHALDYAFWGLDPLGHHLTNIILHAVNASMVVLITIRILEVLKERTTEIALSEFLGERTILITGGATGVLFGFHPIHVESVAWVAERKDVLCALFFLMSINFYMIYIRTGCQQKAPSNFLARLFNRYYCTALVFFLLALLSKPMAVTLPVVLLILDWYPFNRISSLRTLWATCIEKLPFFVLSVVSSIVTIYAQRAGDSVTSLNIIPLSTRLQVGAKSLITYLEKMLLPLNLVPFYPYPQSVSLPSVEYLLAISTVIAITAACVVFVKKQKLWLSVWGYYVIMLIPVLGIVQVGNQAMADRYTYLPSLGPFLIVGLCVAVVVEKMHVCKVRGIFKKLAFLAGASMFFLIMSHLTIRQIDIWESGFDLWNKTIMAGFETATALNNRGISFNEMGQRDKAIEDFERAIAIDPRNYFAYNNRGMLYGQDGLYGMSVEYFRKAIIINPKHADSYCNLGLSYFYLHQYNSALENYNKAIELKQDFDVAYLNRANLFLSIGNKELASEDYRKACALGNNKACELYSLLAH